MKAPPGSRDGAFIVGSAGEGHVSSVGRARRSPFSRPCQRHAQHITYWCPSGLPVAFAHEHGVHDRLTFGGRSGWPLPHTCGGRQSSITPAPPSASPARVRSRLPCAATPRRGARSWRASGGRRTGTRAPSRLWRPRSAIPDQRLRTHVRRPPSERTARDGAVNPPARQDRLASRLRWGNFPTCAEASGQQEAPAPPRGGPGLRCASHRGRAVERRELRRTPELLLGGAERECGRVLVHFLDLLHRDRYGRHGAGADRCRRGRLRYG